MTFLKHLEKFLEELMTQC